MKFDRYDETDMGGTLFPDGTHECEIKSVKTINRKSDGRELIVISFRHAEGQYDDVSKYLDPNERRDHKAAMQLLGALGLPCDSDVDDSLNGRTLQVTTKRAVRDGQPVLDAAGVQRVYVNGFNVSSAPAWEREPEKSVAKRTPTQKADAVASGGTDDIPF